MDGLLRSLDERSEIRDCFAQLDMDSPHFASLMRATCCSSYVPDLPGCVATGETAAEREIREAIRFYIDGLQEHGLPVPQPTSIAEYGKA